MGIGQIKKCYLGRTSGRWAIGLVDYDWIAHVVHHDVLESHVRRFASAGRVWPCLDSNTVSCPFHVAVSDCKPVYISLIDVFSQASHTKRPHCQI